MLDAFDRMADQLRPYMFGSSSSSSSPAGEADGDEKLLGMGGGSTGKSSGGGDVPLLTVSDINPDMLEVIRQSIVLVQGRNRPEVAENIL